MAGRLVHHRRRKLVMVTAEVSQAVALAVLIAAPSGARKEILYGLAVVTGVGGTISQVFLRAIVPDIVGQDLRARANSLLVTGRSLAMVLGFASAGVVLGWAGYRTAFIVDAASFVVSAAILTALPITGPKTDAQAEEDAPESFVAAQRTAVRFLWAAPVLLPMIAIRAIDGLGSSSHNVALPVYSSMLDPHHPAAFMSGFWVLWAIGNIAFQQFLSRYSRRTGRTFEERAFALGTCLMSAAFILAFCGFPPAVTAVTALVAGAADGFTEVSYISRLQSVPDDRRGYVFGFSATVENLGVGVGMVLTSAALEFLPPLDVVAAAHGTAIVMALAFLARLVRAGRRPDSASLRRSRASAIPPVEEVR